MSRISRYLSTIDYKIRTSSGSDTHTLDPVIDTSDLLDDFNVPKTLAKIRKHINEINRFKGNNTKLFRESRDNIISILDLLGFQINPKKEFDMIDDIMESRNKAKFNHDYALSDKLREHLTKDFNILVEDNGDKSVWIHKFL